MIITKKHLSRRAVLRGAGGIVIALPFLDAMHPALSAELVTPTAAAARRRLVIVEYPHGVVDDTWNPPGQGGDLQLSESLAPLGVHRDKLTVVRGLTSSPDRTKVDFHDRAVATFLTGCEPARGKIQVGVSMDQIAARNLAADTPFTSLELGTQPVAPFGSLCFSSATTNLPIEINPRRLFERLFGDSDRIDPAAQAARLAEDMSILDAVTERITGLKRQLGAADGSRLSDYLDSIREIERRVSIAMAAQNPTKELPRLHRPPGIPDSWPDHVKIMFDLQVLALQTDLTRVITFQMAAEASPMTFPHLGLSMEFHEISHHNNQPHKLAALTRINTHTSELFAHFLDKLAALEEPGGSVLDQSVVLYASNLSNPSIHSQRNLPIVVAGGSAHGIKGGRYVRLSGVDTPLANLHVAILQHLQIPTEKLGDSSGVLNVLRG